MKIATTTAYNSLARGDARVITWKMYVRTVTSLSQALSGAWTDVTDRIPEMPDIETRIEYEMGQLKSDTISLTGEGVAWWKGNVFSSATMSDATKYIELKTEFQIAGATDVIPMFAGFVDKVGITYNELLNTVSFSAFTAEDMGYRKPAELVCAQPLKKNADGAGNDGLILINITGMYVIDANIATFVMQAGVHVVSYVSSGTTASLDGGTPVSLGGGGTKTLISLDGTQKLKVFIGPESLPGADTSDDVVVVAAGTKIPKRWYKDVNSRLLLTKLYEQLGLTSVVFDTLEFRTWDTFRRLSYIDTPPNNDGIISEAKNAIETDGTNLYIAVDKKIYFRETLTGVYTLKGTLTNITPERMVWNARTSHLWIFGQKYICRFDALAGTFSNELLLNSVGNEVDVKSWLVLDYNYTGASWQYGIVFTDINGGTAHGRLRFIDGTAGTLAAADIVTGDTLLYTVTGIQSLFMYKTAANIFRFRVINNSSQHAYREYSINNIGGFLDGGEKLAGIDAYCVGGVQAAYHAGEGRIYYDYTGGASPAIRSHTNSSTTPTTVYTTASNSFINCIYFSPVDSVVYFTTDENFSATMKFMMASINIPTQLATGVSCILNQMVGANSRLYLLNNLSSWPFNISLYQFSDQVVPNIPLADFKGKSISDAINQSLRAFNYMATPSAAKKALVYRRGDSAGVPMTSGNTVSITVTDAGDLTEDVNAYAKVDLVKVTGQTISTTWNGTAFGVELLSDRRVFDISNDFIPDAIVKDVAYYLYQFLKTDRTLYKIKLAGVLLFQFEPFDACSITFTTTIIQKTATGIIYGATYKRDGSMELQVLI